MANIQDITPSSKKPVTNSVHDLQLLVDVSRTVAMQDSLEDVLATLAEISSKETGAQRGTFFLHDNETGELYSRYAQGSEYREIRVMNDVGIAGHVYQQKKGIIINDAYADERFDATSDRESGFKTSSILCVPLCTVRGDLIGVVQTLNKIEGQFDEHDLSLLESIAQQVAITLQTFQTVEQLHKSRETELEFLNVVSDVTSELELGSLVSKVMGEATRMLKADRSTLFVNDEKTNELWAMVGEGLDNFTIRLPNHLGIAGAVFQSGETINIPYAYADLRFNPAIDKQSNFFTRSILCVPVVTKQGKVIGVTQVLNKMGGPFTAEDETRLRTFTAQISIGIENATLFDDVQKIKNYNESMLESMSNGVITLDEEGVIVTCNGAGLSIMGYELEQVLKQKADDFFGEANAWFMAKVDAVRASGEADHAPDAEVIFNDVTKSINITVQPLKEKEGKTLGIMILMEDISEEKRVKATMSRIVDPSVADQLLQSGGNLGGQMQEATLLFSDIRGFTTLTETLGAQGTVSMLNDYFTLMDECIRDEGGILDKFIGDAIMAEFGVPIAHDDDPDRAVRCAINMLKVLQKHNVDRAELGQAPIGIGIGINTGSVVAGTIGAPKRQEYTVIGDGVNLAARLESACKAYASEILVSANTWGLLKGTYRAREIDYVVVKGKTEPVGVYQIVDHLTEETFPNMMTVLERFREGLDCYRRADFKQAIHAFNNALAANSNDRISGIYIERCEHLIKEPPKGEWDGIWTMTSK